MRTPLGHIFWMKIRVDLELSIFQHETKTCVSTTLQIDRCIHPSNQMANWETVILQFCQRG